jgi:hypothetical protein
LADIRSSQVLGQVEWQKAGAIKASQVIAQVEYVKPPLGEYTGDLIIEVTPGSEYSADYVYTGDVSAALIPDSSYHPGNEFPYDGDVSVALTPSSDVVVAFCYTGDVTVELIPESDTIGSHGYEGVCTISLEPASAYSIPIPGFDHYFGYGLIDLTFLDGSPPYYCEEGEITGALILEATVEPYRQLTIVGSGGLEISGEGAVVFTDPSVYTVIGSGGLGLNGAGSILYETPETYSVIGAGGLDLDGEGLIVFVDSEGIEYAVIGSGGLAISGAGTATFVRILPSYTVIGSGGLVVGGIGTVTFVDAVVVEYAVTGSGGFKVSGLGDAAFVVPTSAFTLIGSGGLITSGAGLIARLSPRYFTVVGSGGLIVSGEGTGEEFVYQTWVLSGSRRKASIYSNYNFNSYCEYQGGYYGANEAGISILESTADGDNVIHTGVAIGPTNFGTFNRKKIRSVFVGSKNDALVNVSMNSENTITEGSFLTNKGKAVISRRLIGEEVTVNVVDFNELTSVEVVPIILGSRKSR